MTPSSISRVKLILPALTEATGPYWRPVKYSLFPPLGLAILAAYFDPDLGSFVFGLDGDDRDVFARTVDWAVAAGLTTATFHILTPYPGTWKKFERARDLVIRVGQLSQMRPLLEAVLGPVTSHRIGTGSAWRGDADDGSAALGADGRVDRGGNGDPVGRRAAAAALPLRGAAGGGRR